MKTSTLEANKEVILDVMQKFQLPTGKVNWGAAFQNMPDLKETLGIKEGENKQPLYLYVSKLRKQLEFDKNPNEKRFSPKTLKLNQKLLKSEEETRERKRLYQKAYRDKRNRSHENNTQNRQENQDIQGFVLKHVHFCPSCGISLQAVEMALRLANK